MLLNCHSHFSLRYGTLSEKELLRLAQENGYTQIALTDINNTSACLNFVRLAPKYGIRPILGIDFREQNRQYWIALAHNNEGFREINSLLSHHKHTKKALPQCAPVLANASVVYPLASCLRKPDLQLAPHEYIGVRADELLKIPFSSIAKHRDRIVILQPLTIRHQRDHNIHRILRAIDHNTLLTKIDPRIFARKDEHIIPYTDLLELYRHAPYIISNTKKLLEKCNINFDFGPDRPHQNKQRYSATPEHDSAMIRQLCAQGIRYRYGQETPQIRTRIEKELSLIEQMDYIPFFLINWDIIQYAKQKGYYHVGRGSGANSIVAYLLGITDVDPIELDLYFERFMNLYRSSPPDFDIDFSWRDREDVTQYIFDRFGQKGQTALLATYNGFKHRAAVREIGKVFGLPNHEIEVLSKGKYQYDKLDKLSQLTHRYAQYMQEIPNHLSVHAGGIVIAERDIHYFTATNLPPKGFPTTQFDMVIAEDVGLYKYDILGQRGLGKIKDAISLVRKNQPDAPEVDIHDVKPLKNDPAINAMVSRAECIGCFYVESPAMRMLLTKLKVNNYLDLVAASSIIRPGVAKSGMMKEYILRHKDPKRRKRAHPVMAKIMPDTYGVMVYQEDVIKVAHHFAGLDLGEADVLRRAMSGKYRSRDEFLKVRDKYFQNCRSRGYTDQLSREIWNQIESFAGYAFAKGHSASYAVESYQSLYLKHYYPLEYMVATLNNGGGYYRPEIYIHEARMRGGRIHSPHINHSEYETTIQGTDIYLGFYFLQGMEVQTARMVLSERKRNGVFQSFEDFMKRVDISLEQLDILIRIDAFRHTGEYKRNLLWKAHLQHRHQRPVQATLFEEPHRKFDLPELPSGSMESIFDQIELLGFPIENPFGLLAEPLDKVTLARHMKDHIGHTITLYGYLVTAKSTKTSNGRHMRFGTFLDVEGEWIDTVHFPPVLQRHPFRGPGIYKIAGKVVEEFGYLSIEVNAMEKQAFISDPRYSE